MIVAMSEHVPTELRIAQVERLGFTENNQINRSEPSAGKGELDRAISTLLRGSTCSQNQGVFKRVCPFMARTSVLPLQTGLCGSIPFRFWALMGMPFFFSRVHGEGRGGKGVTA